MAKTMDNIKKLSSPRSAKAVRVTFGVCATSDPRIDKPARERCVNIIEMVAQVVAGGVKMPDGTPVSVVWSPVLIDGEKQADIVGQQFRASGVDAVICTPDTWAFPQLTLQSLMSQLPTHTPINITC